MRLKMKEDCILIQQKCYEHKFLLFIALPFAAHGSSLYKNKMTIFLQFLRSFEDAISNVVAMAVLVLQSQGILSAPSGIVVNEFAEDNQESVLIHVIAFT